MSLNSDDEEAARASIKRESGAFEMYHVTTFKGYRENAQGKIKALTVEIQNSGFDYFVIATDENGRQAIGNPNGNLDSAIRGVHWDDLDKDRLK